MITHASFRNFKSLRDVDVDFERLTVIVGPNASGKTSILQGLKTISAYAQPNSATLIASLDSLQNRMADQYKIELRASSQANEIRIVLAPLGNRSGSPREQTDNTPRNTESLMTWQLTMHYEQIDHGRTNDGGAAGWRSVGRQTDPAKIERVFRSVKLCKFDPQKLPQTSHGSKADDSSEDGQGLASRLALVALKDPESFEVIQGYLRTLIPSIRRIRFDRVSVTKQEIEQLTVDELKIPRQVSRTYQEDLILLDTDGGKGIPANLASEGTLLALGLIAELIAPSRPEVLLIDDIEHGLHPKAQRQVVKLIREILEENPELQIIATTHSPFIVNELDPAEVRVTFATEDGSTCCQRLDQHPEFERWKDELWPGEFWSVVGEEWIVNGKPVEQRG